MAAGVAIVGFGEAGTIFARVLANTSVPGTGVPAIGVLPVLTSYAPPGAVCAYDVKTGVAALAAAKWRDYAGAGVTGAATLAGALAGAASVFSVVTADQALACAREAATSLAPGALWFDMNSVAPDTKRAAAAAIEAAGGRYVDVAVMAPLLPAAAGVPLLVCGPHAQAAAEVLEAMGFTRIRVVEGPVGRASAIKMIRSVVVKGMEALSAECVLAAQCAGVLDEVLGSLDASPPPAGWRARADYNLERMMVHGLRRAAEMEEVVKTLDALGTGSAMSRGTVARQRAVGALGLAPAAGLDDKIAAIRALPTQDDRAKDDDRMEDAA